LGSRGAARRRGRSSSPAAPHSRGMAQSPLQRSNGQGRKKCFSVFLVHGRILFRNVDRRWVRFLRMTTTLSSLGRSQKKCRLSLRERTHLSRSEKATNTTVIVRRSSISTWPVRSIPSGLPRRRWFPCLFRRDAPHPASPTPAYIPPAERLYTWPFVRSYGSRCPCAPAVPEIFSLFTRRDSAERPCVGLRSAAQEKVTSRGNCPTTISETADALNHLHS